MAITSGIKGEPAKGRGVKQINSTYGFWHGVSRLLIGLAAVVVLFILALVAVILVVSLDRRAANENELEYVEPQSIDPNEPRGWGVAVSKAAAVSSYKSGLIFVTPEGAYPGIDYFIAVDVSADSKHVAVTSQDGRTYVRSIPSLDLELTLPTNKYSTQPYVFDHVAFACSGKILVTGDYHGNLVLWDMPAGKAITALDLSTIPKNRRSLYGMAVNGDGKFLLTGHYGYLMLWELPSGKLLHEFTCYGDTSIENICINPDDRYFIAASYESKSKTHHIQAFEIPSCQPVEAINQLPDVRPPFAFSQDGKLLATGFADEIDTRPRIWGFPDGEFKSIQVGHGNYHTLAFSPDGTMLGSASSTWATYVSYLGVDRHFNNLSVGARSAVGTFSGMHPGCFSVDSKYLVVPDHPCSDHLEIIDLSRRLPAVKIKDLGSSVYHVEFTVDGKYLVVLQPTLLAVCEPSR